MENPLKRWLRIRDIEAKDAATLLGVSASTLSRIMANKTAADPLFLAAVNTMTGGSVSPNDWISWIAAQQPDSRQERKKART
jgi:DNA-binding transcriptional regulator YdaS (Cro superfamily)